MPGPVPGILLLTFRLKWPGPGPAMTAFRTPPMLIAHLTDLHIRPRGKPAYRVSETNALTERAIDAIDHGRAAASGCEHRPCRDGA